MEQLDMFTAIEEKKSADAFWEDAMRWFEDEDYKGQDTTGQLQDMEMEGLL